jgi:hypothetical protein
MDNPSARSPEGPRSPVKVWRRIYAEQPSRVCENDSLALRVDFLSDLTAKLLIKDKASGSEMACNASFDARSICTGCQGIFYEQIYEKRGSCAVVGSDPDSVPVAPVADTEPQYISIPQTSLRLYGDLPRIRYAGTGGTLQSLMCTP